MISNSKSRIFLLPGKGCMFVLFLALGDIKYTVSDIASMTCDDSSSEECFYKNSRLSPSDLPLPKLFDDFEPPINVTLSKQATTIKALPGSIRQQGKHLDTLSKRSSKFAVLPQLLPRTVVSELLTLLRGNDDATEANGYTTIFLDRDPDTVDGMATQEFFIDNDNLRRGAFSKGDPSENMEERRELRAQIKQLTDPYLHNVLMPFLLEWYGKQKCGRPGRVCTPCYSLIRRYRAGERQSHATHFDAHSFVTVVVSLVDYGREYRGGLYVSTKSSQKEFIGLDRGDALVHQGDLHHGVKVLDTRHDGQPSERWSWILWFRDSDTCDDNSNEWYHQCAVEGNPTCMYLHATREPKTESVVRWNRKASDAGHAQASVKLAYAYLKLLPSHLNFDRDAAEALFQSAIDSSNEPDGHYGLASLYLENMKQNIQLQPGTSPTGTQTMFKIIHHLEEAAKSGHVFAMFNLGMCYTYGYHRKDGLRDYELAVKWFEASGLPEGMAAKALYLEQIRNITGAEEYRQKALILGFGTFWRKTARERTGSGGSSGANLNLPWPPLPTGEMPPEW